MPLGWILLSLACTPSTPIAHAQDAESAPAQAEELVAWPLGPVTAHALQVPEGFGVRRIALDPGHGAASNPGNSSARCEAEQDAMMRLSSVVAAQLEATGHFEVRLSRAPGELVDYPERVRQAQVWGAEALVSLHSDSRGPGSPWSPSEGLECMRQDNMAGFMVLWSDEGPPELAQAREALAVSLSWRMSQAGFTPYDGTDHGALYGAHPSQAGAFVDRHAPGKRILMLRRPEIPSVIVETYHAWDPAELARWDQEATVQAFSAALAQGLVDTLSAQD